MALGGSPIGRPGEEQEFQAVCAGQIYSSSRDMAAFLAANMGELAGHGARNAMAFAQQPVFTVSPPKLGLAWQNVSSGTCGSSTRTAA
jgi:hypothetical protein